MRRLRRADAARRASTTLSAGRARVRRARVAEATPVGRIHGWAGVPGFLRRSLGPGWALVGDAGYFKDPITTHGMTDALRDAELLASALLQAWSGELRRARRRWPRTRRSRDRLSAHLFAATDADRGLRLGPPPVQALLRRVSSAMSDEVELPASRCPPRRRLGPSGPHLG